MISIGTRKVHENVSASENHFMEEGISVIYVFFTANLTNKI